MTIPELNFYGAIYRGLDISKNKKMQKQFDDYKTCFACGVVKNYPAPSSTSFNDEKVRRQAKPPSVAPLINTIFASPSYTLFNLLFVRSMLHS